MTDELTVEERARAQGWKPKEEFDGPEDNWRPAEEFLERGEKILPILQERFGKMERDLASTTKELDRVTDNLKNFAQFHKGTYKRAYENAKRDIERRMQLAEQDGDFEGYKQASEDLRNVESDMQQIDQQMPEQPDPVPEFLDFKRANPWYEQDPAMTVFANHVADNITADQVNNNVEFYALIEQEVKRHFPHKFQGGEAPAVEEGSGEGTTVEDPSKKSWRDLPKEAKEAYNMQFADIPDFSKEDYAKDYWAQEEGVPAWNR